MGRDRIPHSRAAEIAKSWTAWRFHGAPAGTRDRTAEGAVKTNTHYSAFLLFKPAKIRAGSMSFRLKMRWQDQKARAVTLRIRRVMIPPAK